MSELPEDWDEMTEPEKRSAYLAIATRAQDLLDAVTDYAQAGDIDLTSTRKNLRMLGAIAKLRAVLRSEPRVDGDTPAAQEPKR